MFPGIDRKWNPVTGCDHACPFKCWARELALKYQRWGKQKYRFGFIPTFHEDVWRMGPPKAKSLFVVDMGDLFCESFSLEQIVNVLTKCYASPPERNQEFLLCTKNPQRYVDVLNKYPALAEDKRFVFGATVETEDDASPWLSKVAPLPSKRMEAMMHLRRFGRLRTAISVEPIQKINPRGFAKMLSIVNPEKVWVGYDNYESIPGECQPYVFETQNFINELKGYGLKVVEKTIHDPWGVDA